MRTHVTVLSLPVVTSRALHLVIMAGDLATAGTVPLSTLARHLAERTLPKSGTAGPQPERFPPQGKFYCRKLVCVDRRVILLRSAVETNHFIVPVEASAISKGVSFFLCPVQIKNLHPLLFSRGGP